MARRTSDAEEALRRALQNDPLSKSLTTELGCNSYYARRFDESINEYHDALAIEPRNFMAVYGLARSLNQVGKYQEAIDEINNGTSSMPSVPTIGIAERAFASAKLGRRRDAEKDLKTLDQLSGQIYVDPFFSAIIYLGMEDKEATLRSLEKAAAVRSSLMPSIVNDVKFDPMRSEPRFQDLLHRIGFKGLDGM
jgi:tetratricopeptide (TPR) repeat protein